MSYGIFYLGLLIVCVIHAVKTGRMFPWIYVIVFLPMVGCLAYLAVEVAPDLLRGSGSRRFASGVRAATDPNRGFRQAQRAAEMVGSVDSKRALAEQYMRRGQYGEAIALYEGLLVGQFSEDPALLQGLARARFFAGDGQGAQDALDKLQKTDPSFISADEQLLYARALELQGKDGAALSAYKKVVPIFAGEEARCRYAMLLNKTGAVEQARSYFEEILKSLDGAPRHYRRAQKAWGSIARSALR